MSSSSARPFLATVLLLAIVCAGCDDPESPAAVDASSHGADAAADGAPDAAVPGELASFRHVAATAVCATLYRCCDGADVAAYFAPLEESTALDAFDARLPPTDEASCVDVLEDIYDVLPFGDWIRAAEHGDVSFDAAAFASCVQTLAQATCGPAARAALFDGTCLGFAAAAGGAAQRRMFTRTAAPGSACSPLRDGVGATFYGTCDPTRAFCCYTDPARPDSCVFPFAEGGVARPGTCKPASAEGEPCEYGPEVQLCTTGLDCDDHAGACVAQSTAVLAPGDACSDEDFNTLGVCPASTWCDVFGTRACEPTRADGETCSFAEECAGGACVGGVCGENDYCAAP